MLYFRFYFPIYLFFDVIFFLFSPIQVRLVRWLKDLLFRTATPSGGRRHCHGLGGSRRGVAQGSGSHNATPTSNGGGKQGATTTLSGGTITTTTTPPPPPRKELTNTMQLSGIEQQQQQQQRLPASPLKENGEWPVKSGRQRDRNLGPAECYYYCPCMQQSKECIK